MSEQASQPVRRPRINPFAFPSETSLRFVLLVIFVLCGSAAFYEDFQGGADQAGKDCASEVLSQFPKMMSMTASNDLHLQVSTFHRFLSSIAACDAFLLPELIWK